MQTSNLQISAVKEAFSKQAVIFDDLQEQNPILTWMRGRIRNHVLEFVKPGANMLELNAGTGLDAMFFAEKGIKVFATDHAKGMIDQLKLKIENNNLQNKIEAAECSFLNLQNIYYKEKFDAVYSNFGGLNCTDNLQKVINDLKPLLKPGAVITFAIMPPVCPWEILYIFRGKLKLAFRRMQKKGATSHLEGQYFNTFYYTPQQVINYFGNRYKVLKLEGLGYAVPPPYMENFPRIFPKLFTILKKFDDKFSTKKPFRNWGDYFVLSMQYVKE